MNPDDQPTTQLYAQLRANADAAALERDVAALRADRQQWEPDFADYHHRHYQRSHLPAPRATGAHRAHQQVWPRWLQVVRVILWVASAAVVIAYAAVSMGWL